MKNIYQKLKDWYRGKFIPLSIEEMIDIQIPKYLENKKPMPNQFNPPLIAKIINPIWHFWLKRWPILLPVIAGSIIALFIHFDSKPNSESPQKHNTVPTVQTSK